MIISANQPYLFPYLAYWQLINLSHTHIITDNMQFVKQRFITRNSILLHKKAHQFTLQTYEKNIGKNINEIMVGKNTNKILRSIYFAYKRAPYFDEVYPMIEEIFLQNEDNLTLFLTYSIKRIARYLGMDTKFIFLSELQGETTLKLQERVLDMCKLSDTTHFVNAIGGQKLYSKEAFLAEGVKLSFIKMDEIQYKQFNNEFVPNLSIVDVLMFNGKEKTKELLNKYQLL